MGQQRREVSHKNEGLGRWYVSWAVCHFNSVQYHAYIHTYTGRKDRETEALRRQRAAKERTVQVSKVK